MPNTHYKHGAGYAADMAVYARAMASDNSAQFSRLKRNLVRAQIGRASCRDRVLPPVELSVGGGG